MSIQEILKRKAMQSVCRFKVSAIAFNKKGEILGTSVNSPFLSTYGGGNHAEMVLLRRYGANIHSMIICRVGRKGDLLPIDPCHNCATVLKKNKIKVTTIGEM